MATLLVSPDAPVEELCAVLPAERPAPAPVGGSSARGERIAQTALLVVLFAAPALMCVHAACVTDPDIWWHLRTGQWILSHHAVPRIDPFSGPNAGKPWSAYSWLFELVAIQLFGRFGLAGIVGYSAAMVLAITVALHHLVKRLQPDFSLVALLTFAACFSLGHLFTPRPWLFTILFFVLEIDILMHARRTGRARELAWLPLLFALWSNLHIQFIDGLAVLALAVAEACLSKWLAAAKTPLRAAPLAAALAASIAATLANPYGWHIYRVAYDLAAQTGVMSKISELQAIPFRDLLDYCVLFLALAAAAAVARSRRLPVFELGLLLFGAVVSFRSQRDEWVIVTVAIASLASMLPQRRKPALPLPWFATLLAVVVASLATLGGFRMMHIDNRRLERQLETTLPVKAVEAIQAQGLAGPNNGLAGPLYNDFNWGGYLIWALRMPVSIDGRAAFYGDAAIDRAVATWTAEPDWATDPQLTSAGMVIGSVKAPLTQLLRLDPRWRLAYEDKLAAVFVRR